MSFGWPAVRGAQICGVSARRLSVLFLISMLGCASIDPSPDYAQAGDLITARTGIPDIYEPGAEDIASEKVTQLLAGGLTADEAASIALLNNREFQALFLEIGVSRAEVVQSGLLSNPTLFFNILFPSGGGRTKLTYGIAQELVELWQLPKRKKIATDHLEATILRIVRKALEINKRAKIAVFNLASAQRIEEVSRRNAELSREAYELVERRVQAGDASELDANIARASSIDAYLETVTARRDRETAEATLRSELSLSPIDGTIELIETLEPVTLKLSESELIEQAQAGLLELQIAAAETSAAEAELLRQYRLVVPSLKLGGSAERTATRTSGPETIDDLFGPSLQVTLPIWDRNKAQIARARIKALQKRKEYEHLQFTVTETIRKRASELRATVEIVDFYRVSIPLAEQNVEGARLVYQSGEEGVLTVITAQQALGRLNRTYIGTLRDGAIARVELEEALGHRLTAEVQNDE